MRPTQRLHELDALRGLAMLLGVVYHADLFALLFGPKATGASSDALAGVGYGLHAFRMPLFFLVAGFFAALVVARRGTDAFIAARLRRIGLPLAVGLVTIVPATQAAIALAEPRAAEPLLAWPPVPVHLWFLWYLVLFYALALLARAVVPRPVLGRVLQGARRVLYGRWWLVPAILSTAALLWPMRSLHLDTPTSFLPDPATFAAYAVFFAVGWVLFGHPDPVAHLGRGWRFALPIALVLVVVGTALSLWHAEEQIPRVARAAGLVVGSTLTWATIVFLAGLMSRHYRSGSPAVRYVADASYWMYLVHPPIVLLCVALFDELGAGVVVTFLAANAVTFPIVFATYAVAVRHTAIGRVLHGPRPTAAALR